MFWTKNDQAGFALSQASAREPPPMLYRAILQRLASAKDGRFGPPRTAAEANLQSGQYWAVGSLGEVPTTFVTYYLGT